MSRRSMRLLLSGYYRDNSDMDEGSSSYNVSYRESPVRVFKRRTGSLRQTLSRNGSQVTTPFLSRTASQCAASCLSFSTLSTAESLRGVASALKAATQSQSWHAGSISNFSMPTVSRTSSSGLLHPPVPPESPLLTSGCSLEEWKAGRTPTWRKRSRLPNRPGGSLSEAKQAWRNAAHPALQNQLKDLAWMALHEVLPVRAVMHSRGMARIFTCPRPGCGHPETVWHLLWECGVARDLWAATSPLECPCLPAGEVHPTYHLVVNGVGQGANTIPAADFATLWLTLNCMKAALWTSGNLLVGKRVVEHCGREAPEGRTGCPRHQGCP